MVAQPNATFGQALKRALRVAHMSQADLARHLQIDPGQVSRWVNDKAVPHIGNLTRIEEAVGADLSQAFERSTPRHELYVAAPITGLSAATLAAHHAAVATVVGAAREHVNSLYWPGELIRSKSDLSAADIATEHNMRTLAECTALLYLQFEEVVHPSGSLIELGIALGRRMKTTIISLAGLRQPFMLDGFGAVASSLNFLPKARLYTVASINDARELVQRNGRELLGLT